jgi:sulfur transfer protein SufE
MQQDTSGAVEVTGCFSELHSRYHIFMLQQQNEAELEFRGDKDGVLERDCLTL